MKKIVYKGKVYVEAAAKAKPKAKGFSATDIDSDICLDYIHSWDTDTLEEFEKWIQDNQSKIEQTTKLVKAGKKTLKFDHYQWIYLKNDGKNIVITMDGKKLEKIGQKNLNGVVGFFLYMGSH